MEADYGKSSFGFEENVVACASYFFLGPFIYIKERRSDYVRFHALQATLGYAFLLVFWLVVKFISALYFLAWAPGILALGFVAFMMKKAFDGEEFKMPIIGRLAFQAVYETADDVLAEAEEEAQAAPKPNEKSGGKG